MKANSYNLVLELNYYEPLLVSRPPKLNWLTTTTTCTFAPQPLNPIHLNKTTQYSPTILTPRKLTRKTSTNSEFALFR